MPFDGMNEHGLAIGMAAVPELSGSPGEPTSKPTIGSIGVMRLVLDHARTVDEAVSLFAQYTLDFTGGPPVHYLLADPSGKAVLVEFYQGRMQALPNQDDWHLATNHLRCIAEGDGGCRRYAALSERLAMANGLLDEASALDLLARVAQPTTQWSAVYNMSRGELSLALGTDFESPLYFQLTTPEASFGE